jgi:exodeoxyribonuclease-3
MPLRILSYNILAGGENRLPLIANIIQQQHPHIVALQEARSRSNAEALAHQLGMSLTFGEAHNVHKDHVAWLSRLPVIYFENHPFPMLAKTLLEIEVIWEGITLALFTTHLKAGQDLVSEQHRIAEMQAILQLLQAYLNQSQVLVGDFNTLHPIDHPITLADTSYTSHQALRVDYIFASPSLAERLSACEIITEGEAERASDHFPIWAEFK